MRVVFLVLVCAAAALAACECGPGEQCDLNGECAPRCVAALCEVWNATLGACAPACAGCTACAEGLCVPAPELRNPCGACPGDAGYALCASVAGPAALGCPLVVRGVDIVAALNNITCDNRDAYARLPCTSAADCATCDACRTHSCVAGACVAAPVVAPGCGPCVSAAECAPAPCVDARCSAGACVRRVLPLCAP